MKTKNFLIYAMLFAPIVAHATNPVGPSAVGQGQTAVVATASAPYATATAENGDTTNVVSASYVKGAYNDAIAAINNVANKVSDVEGDLSDLSDFVNNDIEDEIDDKQNKLFRGNSYTGEYNVELSTNVIGVHDMDEYMRFFGASMSGVPQTGGDYEDNLVTADGVAAGIMAALSRTGIRAVTTWGDDDTTVVPHVGDSE